MGGKRSFWIESKRFDLTWEERGQVKFTEIGKHHRCDIFTGREGAIWLGRCVEENLNERGNKLSYEQGENITRRMLYGDTTIIMGGM